MTLSDIVPDNSRLNVRCCGLERRDCYLRSRITGMFDAYKDLVELEAADMHISSFVSIVESESLR